MGVVFEGVIPEGRTFALIYLRLIKQYIKTLNSSMIVVFL